MRNAIAAVAATIFALSAAGCGSGGSSGSAGGSQQSSRGSPSIEVLPTTFDFGRVTANNTSAPLEVTIRNTGSASLSVSSIGFSAASSPAFTLSFTGGTRPCGSAAPTVAAGDSCTFRVAFQPAGNGAFSSNVQIASNAGSSPFGLPITGVSEALSALTVRINQVNTSCPNSNAATAFVSVVDQGGFPLLGLAANNFTLTEGAPASANLLLGVTRLDAAYPVAIAAVLDNSGSVTNQPVMYADMKNGFAALFNSLRANDVGELINFGSQYEITVAFPSPSSVTNPTNKTALVAGLSVPWTKGSSTLLYDSVYKAIDDTAAQTAYRRAVIVATDGADDLNGTGQPASTRTLTDVISNAVAKKVPVFAIGIGGSLNSSVLRDLAAETGGLYYAANTSQNLATIYQQLSSLLFQNQYVLTFNQLSLGAGTVSPLNVNVVSSTGIAGNASSSIASCN